MPVPWIRHGCCFCGVGRLTDLLKKTYPSSWANYSNCRLVTPKCPKKIRFRIFLETLPKIQASVFPKAWFSRWWFQICFIFIPLWGRWVVQPPTSLVFLEDIFPFVAGIAVKSMVSNGLYPCWRQDFQVVCQLFAVGTRGSKTTWVSF